MFMIVHFVNEKRKPNLNFFQGSIFPRVDYALTGWNQIIAELREWEKIKQAFSLSL